MKVAYMNCKYHDEKMVMLNEMERIGKEPTEQQNEEASIHLLGFRLWSPGLCIVLQVDTQAWAPVMLVLCCYIFH
jgi:hypothetical protein